MSLFIVLHILPCIVQLATADSAKKEPHCSRIFLTLVSSDVGSWWLDHRSPTKILAHAIDDGIRLFVASPGGTGTWDFIHYLHVRGAFSVGTEWTGIIRASLVHAATPTLLTALPAAQAKLLRAAVFILADPLQAVCSMHQRSNAHNVYSFLHDRWPHLRRDIQLPLLDAILEQFVAWTDPALSAVRLPGVQGRTAMAPHKMRAPALPFFPLVYLRYDEMGHDACLRQLCLRLGTCKTFSRAWTGAGPGGGARGKRVAEGEGEGAFEPRDPSRHAECVASLQTRLSAEQRAGVEAMRAYPSTCQRELASPPPSPTLYV